MTPLFQRANPVNKPRTPQANHYPLPNTGYPFISVNLPANKPTAGTQEGTLLLCQTEQTQEEGAVAEIPMGVAYTTNQMAAPARVTDLMEAEEVDLVVEEEEELPLRSNPNLPLS